MRAGRGWWTSIPGTRSTTGTSRHPRRTAGFYNAARRACPRCNVAAGDLLDSGNLARWLARYRPHLRGRPRLWSLHYYLDVNYLRPWRRSGTRGLLRLTRGRLWISETAGIVYYLRAGRLGERHAANATRWMLALPARSRRTTRVYAYQWQAPCHPDIWDSAWFRSDGSSRPSFRVLVAQLTRERRLDPDAAAALNPPALAGGARHLPGQAAGAPPYPAAAAATSFSRVISGSKRGSLTTVTPWSARSLCTASAATGSALLTGR